MKRSITTLLAVVLLAAVGFIGGVKVQKSQGTTTAAATGGRAGGFTGGSPAGGGQTTPVGQTTGTVKRVDGKTVVVKAADGSTVKIKVNRQTKIVRSAKSDAATVHPGDTVVVTGKTASSGTVTATQLQATASNAGN